MFFKSFKWFHDIFKTSSAEFYKYCMMYLRLSDILGQYLSEFSCLFLFVNQSIRFDFSLNPSPIKCKF